MSTVATARSINVAALSHALEPAPVTIDGGDPGSDSVKHITCSVDAVWLRDTVIEHSRVLGDDRAWIVDTSDAELMKPVARASRKRLAAPAGVAAVVALVVEAVTHLWI